MGELLILLAMFSGVAFCVWLFFFVFSFVVDVARDIADDWRTNVSKSKTSTAELKAENEQLKDREAMLEALCETYKKRCEELERQREQLVRQLENADNAKSVAEKESDELDALLRVREAELENLRDILNHSRKEFVKLEHERDERFTEKLFAEREAADTLAQNELLAARVLELEKTNRQLAASCDARGSILDELRGLIAELEAQLERRPVSEPPNKTSARDASCELEEQEVRNLLSRMVCESEEHLADTLAQNELLAARVIELEQSNKEQAAKILELEESYRNAVNQKTQAQRDYWESEQLGKLQSVNLATARQSLTKAREELAEQRAIAVRVGFLEAARENAEKTIAKLEKRCAELAAEKREPGLKAYTISVKGYWFLCFGVDAVDASRGLLTRFEENEISVSQKVTIEPGVAFSLDLQFSAPYLRYSINPEPAPTSRPAELGEVAEQ